MAGASTPTAVRLRQRWFAGGEPAAWRVVWSKPAAIRALRAAIVMPALFVIAEKVIDNPQVALFAAFGSFATLVLVNFAGGWRDKLTAHLALALAGSVLLVIGTAVSSSTALAAIVTVPVAFAVFFSGIVGPNAAAGVTGALLIYVLPAATAGTISQAPDRLAGWWLASVVGTLAVLVLRTPPGTDRLGRAAAELSDALASALERVGAAAHADTEESMAAKHRLLEQFDSTPYRPTGLALPDQALANSVELLEWCTLLIADLVREHADARAAPADERELLALSATVLRQSGALFADGRQAPELDRLEAARRASVDSLQALAADGSEEYLARVEFSFHTQAIATAVIRIGIGAMLSARLVGAEWLSGAGARLLADQPLAADAQLRAARLRSYGTIAARHTSVRSVWFINSLRGALALAAAVALAGLTNAQHGFWVVLGTLSVLRASAASTGAIVLRALLGTVIGFAVGAALIAAVGSSTGALWALLPFAVLIAAYTPGVAPFAVGQAAFTVTVIILFNILIPIGWKVGEYRVEDVALGCAVSLVVGLLVWPRGITGVVGDDLADAFRTGAAYLKDASAWVCAPRGERPRGAIAATRAGSRLDEALRGLLADRGTKQLQKQELWRLVGGTQRLRLTAEAVAALPGECLGSERDARAAVEGAVEVMARWYDELAVLVGRPTGGPVPTLSPPALDGRIDVGAARSRETLWLREHLNELVEHSSELIAPATHLAEVRRRPWWQ